MANLIAEVIKGLTSPTKKLIDAVSKGIGSLYEPHKTKKMADAEAYKIKTISAALSENGDLPTEYSDNHLKITTLDYEELNKRAMYRFVRLETQRQCNIETIADKAYDKLKDNNNDIKEDVSQDWMTKFIISSQDVSEPAIQELWAKILAGEIVHPNSFSFKTLDILKNMSQKDAQIFYKSCSLIIDNSYIPNNDNLLQKYGLSYSDILKMDEQGLINSSGMIGKEIKVDNTQHIFKSKNYLCLANKKSKVQTQVFALTSSAIELISIINFTENEEFIKDYAKVLKDSNVNASITLHKINSIDNELISYDSTDLLSEM